MKLLEPGQGAVPDKTSTHDTGLARLMEVHRGELLRFLAARCGNPVEAEDYLQELWIRASNRAAGPIGNGRAYLFSMANSLVLDKLRARRRAMRRDRNWLDLHGGGDAPVEERLDPAVPADEALANRQEAELLRQAIAALPPGAQQALRLFRLEGLPQTEIAQIMGISRSGVEKHLATAMKHLRNALSDCGFYGSAASEVVGKLGGSEPHTGQRS